MPRLDIFFPNNRTILRGLSPCEWLTFFYAKTFKEMHFSSSNFISCIKKLRKWSNKRSKCIFELSETRGFQYTKRPLFVFLALLFTYSPYIPVKRIVLHIVFVISVYNISCCGQLCGQTLKDG